MCGFLKKFIKRGIGIAGKNLMNFANGATGGLAGKVVDNVIDGVNKHAGVIGKVAQGIGRPLLSDKARTTISNLADSAIKYIPKGNVRTALEKINNAAQGRTNNKATSESIIKTKINKQLDSTEPNSHAKFKTKIKQNKKRLNSTKPNSSVKFIKGGG